MASHRPLQVHVPPRAPADHSQFCLVLCSTLMPADSPTLDAKVAFLRGSCGPDDEAIETHFAWVFLIDDRAWKLRKPVRRDTMDYGSLEARRLDSLEEIRLNRRLAPDVYLGTAPLTLTADGQLAIDGQGEIVDWLVCMRRLDRSRLLEAQLAQGSVKPESLRPVVRLLADFYRTAAPAISDGPAFLARIGRQVEANQQVLAPAGVTGNETLLVLQREFIAKHSSLLAQRAASGCVVEAHGDLRPEHVYLDDSPAIIDCLEFDRDLRVLDRAEELSFLHLECARIGHEATGRALLRGCLALLADHATDALLHFYRGHRATTRAKLYAWRASEPDGGTRREWLDLAGEYVRRALEDSARSLD
jgi:aminoglycoside phosphotransferase family enzyme